MATTRTLGSNKNSWQQQTSRQRQDFASNPTSRGYAEASPTRYGRRSRQYEQGWNSRPAEQSFGNGSQLQSMAEQQASANGIPTSLVDRVIARESGGNPRAVSRGNYGLMQIRLGTARAMGYGGSAAGLLDASTNMTYAVRYLAGAYRAAGGNESRAVALYARGYRAAHALKTPLMMAGGRKVRRSTAARTAIRLQSTAWSVAQGIPGIACHERWRHATLKPSAFRFNVTGKRVNRFLRRCGCPARRRRQALSAPPCRPGCYRRRSPAPAKEIPR